MATYIRLTDYKDSDSKEQGFFKSENRYEAKQDDFEKIPGSPIAYWVSEKFKNLMQNQKISKFAFSDGKNVTGENDKYLKQIWEVNRDNIGQNKKWLFMMKGGEYRKWYGNIEHIIDFDDNARLHYKKSKIGRLIPEYLWFRKGITWSKISSKNASFRLLPEICTFDEVNITLNSNDDFLFVNAFLNTNITKYFLESINQTLSFQTENILSLPVIFSKEESTKQQIDTLTQECIDISKEEWDSRETSWDFTKHELLKHKSDSKIETSYNNYCSYWKEKFYKLHANEEELNRLFIDIYELGDELTPDVALKDITILKSESIINDRGELEFKADEIMKQFISYAVGVMFGRYSLDKDGLQIANLGSEILISQMTDDTKVSFPIDDDNVIPVLEDDYFSDDIASRVINFVKTTFGAESLSENINFIEKCLGKTIRAYMVKDFYEDHIKRYKKRPIYWMVSSPKKGFMSLSYMHRYTNDLFARVQNNYLREYITKLEGTKDILRQIIVDESASSKDKKDADKKIKDIENKLKELISFDRDVLTSYAQNRVDIDLDDGVKVNYNKFKDVLYVIKGLYKE